jgi:hypothetical protein
MGKIHMRMGIERLPPSLARGQGLGLGLGFRKIKRSKSILWEKSTEKSTKKGWLCMWIFPIE